ncbi:MAG: tetratricopeptide repeat protein [Desulfobacterales bacterium]|nr:tetratricopeptide repeat protein [Desulfobacterales bacterium]
MSRFEWLEVSDKKKEEIDTNKNEEVYDEDYYMNLASEKFDEGNYELALRYYSRVLNLNINSQGAWLGQLLCLIDLGEYNESITWADKALELFAGDPEITAVKALAFGRLGDFDKAAAFSDASLKYAKQSYFVWWVRGDIFIISNPNNSEFCFRKALELAHNDASLFLRIGKTFLSMDKPIKAKEFLFKAKTANQDNSLIWYWLGIAYQSLGEFDEAEKCLQRALELKPSNDEFQAALNKIRHTSATTKLYFKIKKLFQ